MYSTELVVQTFISGVMIGVLYALMALGITFIYSIMRMINWAMGEFYMIGSYLQYMLVAHLLGPDLWWLAIPISAAGVFAGYTRTSQPCAVNRRRMFHFMPKSYAAMRSTRPRSVAGAPTRSAASTRSGFRTCPTPATSFR